VPSARRAIVRPRAPREWRARRRGRRRLWLRTGDGSRRCTPRPPPPRSAGRRRGRHARRAMHQLTPASVVVAARLRTAREKRLRPHRGIVGAVPRGRMRRAVPHVEDFTAGISVRLTIRAVGTSDSGGVRKEVRHRSMARIAVAIIRLPLLHSGRPTRSVFRRGTPYRWNPAHCGDVPGGRTGLATRKCAAYPARDTARAVATGIGMRRAPWTGRVSPASRSSPSPSPPA
jgi:hypothetical protein